MKKNWILKVLIAGILAFLVLNVFSIVYYNVPPRVLDKDNTVEYKWPSNIFYSRATEGVAWGRTNNEGFNNLDDYYDGKEINNLFMGSSQAEGFNVSQKENAASVMNSICDSYTYNIGISEHALPICVSNLEAAISKYKPTDYVVIETMTVSFYDEEIEKSLNDEIYLPTYSDGIMGFLQNFKYLKLAYYQYSNLHQSSAKSIDSSINNKDTINRLLSKAKDICESHDVRLIIVYHPIIAVNNDGTVTASYNREDLDIFESECNKVGITFINMEDDFVNNYYDNYELPHGFNNTIPGTGHLNSVGHKLIAYRLKDVMEGIKHDVQ